MAVVSHSTCFEVHDLIELHFFGLIVAQSMVFRHGAVLSSGIRASEDLIVVLLLICRVAFRRCKGGRDAWPCEQSEIICKEYPPSHDLESMRRRLKQKN
jgi:hypothetical protein